MKLQRALAFLENVINHKEAVPMRRYGGSTGRTAQGEFVCIRGTERMEKRRTESRKKDIGWLGICYFG